MLSDDTATKGIVKRKMIKKKEKRAHTQRIVKKSEAEQEKNGEGGREEKGERGKGDG